YTVLCSTPSFFFLFTFRPPPPSPLFPYTTLFRSDLLLDALGGRAPVGALAGDRARRGRRLHHRRIEQRTELPVLVGRELPQLPRSEEHTSELQSRENLVCRLLLEKKKKTKKEQAK